MDKKKVIIDAMEDAAMKSFRMIMKDGTEDQKAEVKVTIMKHRSELLVELFLQAFTEGVIRMGEDEAYKYETEEKVEYLMIPVPVPSGVLEEFYKKVEERCSTCKGNEFCAGFEKSMEASLMKGVIMELIHAQAQLVRYKMAEDFANKFFRKGGK